MEFIFFIPYSIILIVLFFMMGFGMIGVDFLAENILKWQYVILTIMLIIALISDIIIVAESYVKLAFKIIYCMISMFLDSIKQIVSIALIMVFLLQIVNELHKHPIFMIIVGILYIIAFLFIITLTMFACFGINGIASWLLEKLKKENTAYVISLILNVILTAVYFPICMHFINAFPADYAHLFGKSVINSILQGGQNILIFLAPKL